MAGALFKYFQKDTQKLTPDRTVEEVQNEAKNKKLSQDLQKEQFLNDMSQIESSGGKNTKHRMMMGGMHEGEHAVGSFGLMPKTINEMSGRLKNEGNAPSLLNALRNTTSSEQEIADIVGQDPDTEAAIASKMYEHVKAKYPGDEEKMNLAWEVGHNIPTTKLTEVRIEAHPRTEKFRNLRKKLADNK